MNLTRRDLGRIALAALPAAKLAAKPDSVIGGVQVGANVPYSFHNMSGTADKIFRHLSCDPAPVESLRPEVPPAVARVTRLLSTLPAINEDDIATDYRSLRLCRI